MSVIFIFHAAIAVGVVFLLMRQNMLEEDIDTTRDAVQSLKDKIDELKGVTKL